MWPSYFWVFVKIRFPDLSAGPEIEILKSNQLKAFWCFFYKQGNLIWGLYTNNTVGAENTSSCLFWQSGPRHIFLRQASLIVFSTKGEEARTYTASTELTRHTWTSQAKLMQRRSCKKRECTGHTPQYFVQLLLQYSYCTGLPGAAWAGWVLGPSQPALSRSAVQRKTIISWPNDNHQCKQCY